MNTLEGYKLRIGIVTNKNDTDEKGKVQVRIMPDLEGVKENDLPWARPFFTSGMDKNNYSMELPEVGADVFCLIKEDYRSLYYLHGIFVDGFFDYEGVVKSQLDNIDELSDSAYPNINFKLVNDGTIFFHNPKNGDIGLIHNTGTYIIINNSGEGYFNLNGTIFSIIDGTITLETGTIDVKGDTVKLGGETDSAVLFTQLNSAIQTFITSLNSHTHPDPVSGVSGPPSSPMSLDISSAQSNVVKLD